MSCKNLHRYNPESTDACLLFRTHFAREEAPVLIVWSGYYSQKPCRAAR